MSTCIEFRTGSKEILQISLDCVRHMRHLLHMQWVKLCAEPDLERVVLLDDEGESLAADGTDSANGEAVAALALVHSDGSSRYVRASITTSIHIEQYVAASREVVVALALAH